jgi:DNA-binding response OmpR family regulator
MTTRHTILLAEEDPGIRAFLADQLTCDGYRVLGAEDRSKALAVLTARQPDLIIVDVNGETLELLDAIRSGEGLAGRADPDTPMLILTARADELHRVRVLERGGDDIVQKPFSYPELRARIAALLRRADRTRSARVLRVGPLTIDLAAREVRVGERRVALAAKEYELLVALAAEPTRVFTRAELLHTVWGYRTIECGRTLDSHACRLRQKLAGEGQPKLIINIWGIGYRLTDGPLHQAEQRSTVR